MSRRTSWMLTAAPDSAGIFRLRIILRPLLRAKPLRSSLRSLWLWVDQLRAPPANNCCPSPGVYTAQPQPQPQCYP